MTTTVAHASAQGAPPPQAPPAPNAPPGYAPPPYYPAPYPYPYPYAYRAEPPPEEVPNEGQATPPGYRPVTKLRKGPIIGGSITLGTFYVLTLPAADRRPITLLPVLGPLIGAQQRKCDDDKNYDCLGDGFTRLWLYLAFAGQTTGAVLLTVGLTSERKVFLRNDVEAKRTWTVAPVLTPQAKGAAIVGTF